MATIGLAGDVNNSVFLEGAYPVGRSYGMVGAAATDFSMRNNYAGEIGGLNADYRGFSGSNASLASTRGNPAMTQGNGNGSSNGKKPAAWWITFAIILIIVSYVARKYAPDGEQFALVKPNLINGIFLTLWIVLILAFLKQVAIRIKPIPGVSALADLILSV
jgi:hypothetical protein